MPADRVLPPLYVLAAVSASLPAPSLVRLPEPEMKLFSRTLSLRFAINIPLRIMSPLLIAPSVLPEPICNAPALMVVVPLYVLVPVSVNVPVPFLVRLAAPEITPA